MKKSIINIIILVAVAAIIFAILWLWGQGGSGSNSLVVPTTQQANQMGIFQVPGGPDTWMYTDKAGQAHYGTLLEMVQFYNTDNA